MYIRKIREGPPPPHSRVLFVSFTHLFKTSYIYIVSQSISLNVHYVIKNTLEKESGGRVTESQSQSLVWWRSDVRGLVSVDKESLLAERVNEHNTAVTVVAIRGQTRLLLLQNNTRPRLAVLSRSLCGITALTCTEHFSSIVPCHPAQILFKASQWRDNDPPFNGSLLELLIIQGSLGNYGLILSPHFSEEVQHPERRQTHGNKD